MANVVGLVGCTDHRTPNIPALEEELIGRGGFQLSLELDGFWSWFD